MTTDDEPAGEQPLDLERLPEDLEEALAQAMRAAEDLSPLEQLAVLQEAMAGLAQIGAVMGRMRAASQQDEESAENLGEDPDPQRSGCPQEGVRSSVWSEKILGRPHKLHRLQYLSPSPRLVYLK